MAGFPFPSLSCDIGGLLGISKRFHLLSPCHRQIAHALLTRPPLECCPKAAPPLDLHVLGTPPAFILSQDQTLKFSFFKDRFRDPELFLRVLLFLWL